jgi:hypothetical protein
MTEAERESVVQEQITAIGRESFPDNPDVEWEVLGIKHEGRYSFVETLPHPDEVGEERFMFVLVVDDVEQAHCVGCYAFDGSWSLHFDDPKAPTDWQTLAAAPAAPPPARQPPKTQATPKKKFWKFW